MKWFAAILIMMFVATVGYAGHFRTVEVSRSYSAASNGSYSKAKTKTVTRHRQSGGSSGTYGLIRTRTVTRTSSQSSGN